MKFDHSKNMEFHPINMEEFNEKLVIDTTVYETKLTKKYLNRKVFTKKDPKKITAFIPGTIREIYVKKGSKVKMSDPLFVLEAMKMRNTVFAHDDGKIKDCFVSSEQRVAKGELILEFE